MENVMTTVYTWHDPNVEVLGVQVLNFVGCAQNDDIAPFLSKHGLTNVRTDQWYPVQLWLKVLTDIAASQNGMMNLTSLGMKMADVIFVVPDYAHADYEQIIMNYDHYYQRYHRNGDAGQHRPLKIAEKHLMVGARVPYPDDLIYGILYGVTRRHLPSETQFVVYYDDTTPRHDLGGEWTKIHVEWE
jgi:hypothetical protein